MKHKNRLFKKGKNFLKKLVNLIIPLTPFSFIFYLFLPENYLPIIFTINEKRVGNLEMENF
jgi:hypothetical protein